MKIKDILLEAPNNLSGTEQLYVPRGNLNEMFKPVGKEVFWTSTAIKKGDAFTSEWVEWCKSETPHWIGKKGILFKVVGNPRILLLKEDKDLFDVGETLGITRPDLENDRLSSVFDWARKFPWYRLESHYDGVRHIPSGSRLENIMMSTWDVESTAWFNRRNLKKISEVELAL
jgi:hypothetical protein